MRQFWRGAFKRILRFLGFRGYYCDACGRWVWRWSGKARVMLTNPGVLLHCHECSEEKP